MRDFKIEADCGENISNYAKRMIEKFDSIKGYVPGDYILDCGEFNGVQLQCHRHTTMDCILEYFHNQLEENARKYRESDEYKQRKLQDELELKEMSNKAAEMEKAFVDMNKRDYKVLLLWLKDYQALTDRIGVRTNNKMVISMLNDSGYYKNMNIKDRFKEDDMVNVAEYIVGQCIGGLNGIGAIHQVIHKFVDDWIEKWV